jgi:hypothetical protein
MTVSVLGRAIEGSLDIKPLSFAAGGAGLSFHLLFLRYANFRNGAQQPKLIDGVDSLERYLVCLGFSDDDARAWVARASAERSVSIPNVIMPEPELGRCGL